MIIFGKKIKVQINNEQYFRRLGYPGDYDPPEHVEELIDWVKEWFKKNADPWNAFYEIEVVIKRDKLYFNGIEINAPKLLKRYKKHQVKKAILIANTAGNKADKKIAQLWADDISDQSFFLDAYAAAYTEGMVAKAVEVIREWAIKKGLKSLSRFSPGYPGWDLKDQHQLMKVIKNKTKEKIPIQVMESSLLTPKKSQLSVIGLYRGDEVKEVEAKCINCSLLDCQCMN